MSQLPTMKWECNKCGRCCRFWDVQLDKEDMRTIEGDGYRRDDFAERKKEKWILKKRFYRCVFLTKENECRLQKEHGYQHKPKVCRQFPLATNGANPMVCGDFVSIERLVRPVLDKRW